MPTYKILVADDSKVIVHMIAKHFTNKGYEVKSAHNGRDALDMALREKPDVLISDVMMPGLDGYEVVRQVRKNPATAKTAVIMLTTRGGVADRISGLQAGADDYITKPFDLRELELRVRALLARVSRPEVTRKAHTITLFSLKGGTGLTTLTVNLAVALSQMWKTCKVGLVDMSLNNGQVPLFLNLVPRFTLSDLARERLEDISWDLMQNYFLKHESEVSVLSAPSLPTMADLVTPQLVGAFMPALQQDFDYILVDGAHNYGEAMIAMLEHTELVMVVVSPEMAAVKSASDALNALQEMGYPTKQTVLLLNHTFGQGGLAAEDIQEALGKKPVAQIPYEAKQAVAALNRGVPLLSYAPNTATAQEIAMLAYRLSVREMEEREDGEPSQLLAQVKRRIAR